MKKTGYPTGIVVERPITTTEVQTAPSYDYDDYGLPFYYHFSPTLCITLIIAGILLFLVEIGSFLGILVFFRKKKKYICPQCKKIIYQNNNKIPTCPKCKCRLYSEEEYKIYLNTKAIKNYAAKNNTI